MLKASLSVVIPVFNAEAFLATQLDALTAQGGRTLFEVLVADNGSDDGSVSVARRFDGRNGVPVRVLDASRVRGPSHARNAAVSEALSDRIAMCDADDLVGERWVDAMASALREHAYVGGPLEFDRLNPRWAADVRRGTQEVGPIVLRGGPPWPYFIGANLGVRREAHDRIGGFDESLTDAGEDNDYGWRMGQAGITPHWAPDAIVHYRVRSTLGGIYRQAYGYCLASVPLLERYGDVWESPTPSYGRFGRLLRAAWRARTIRSRGDLATWAFKLGADRGNAHALRRKSVECVVPTGGTQV